MRGRVKVVSTKLHHSWLATRVNCNQSCNPNITLWKKYMKQTVGNGLKPYKFQPYKYIAHIFCHFSFFGNDLKQPKLEINPDFQTL